MALKISTLHTVQICGVFMLSNDNIFIKHICYLVMLRNKKRPLFKSIGHYEIGLLSYLGAKTHSRIHNWNLYCTRQGDCTLQNISVSYVKNKNRKDGDSPHPHHHQKKKKKKKKQDLSPDRIARLILHILFPKNSVTLS